MAALTDNSKSKVMFLCQALLADEKAADQAVIMIFIQAWMNLTAGRIGSEDDFTEIVVHRAAVYCKTRLLKENGRVFRTPARLDFSVSCEVEKMNFGGDLCRVFFYNLPPLHRFIYVLHDAFHYSRDEIAKLLKINIKIVRAALETEPQNIKRIAATASVKMKMDVNMDMEKFHKNILEAVENTAVPESVQSVMNINMQNVCDPVRKKEKQKKFRISASAAAFLIAVLLIISLDVKPEDSSEEPSETQSSETAVTHYADITIQDYGTITVALNGNEAPETVENFVSLAESGFYDGLTFHRIIEGFMMQGGDPNGDGTGGSENTIVGEFSDNGYDNKLSHTRGAVSMARSDDYDSASSQFFIVQEDSSGLDGQYAVFGYVTEGMDIVDAICEAANPTDDNGTIPADEQPVITSITITTVEDTDESENAE